MSKVIYQCPVCMQCCWPGQPTVYDERYDEIVCEDCAEEPVWEVWKEEQKKAPE